MVAAVGDIQMMQWSHTACVESASAGSFYACLSGSEQAC